LILLRDVFADLRENIDSYKYPAIKKYNTCFVKIFRKRCK